MISLLMGLLSLACSILGMFPKLIPPTTGLTGNFFGVIGFILAVIAMATGKAILRRDPTDKSAAAGRAIGLICIVLSLIGIALLVGVIAGCVACISCV